MPTAAVIGAGLGGLAAGVALEAAGFEVKVFEKAAGARREAGSISLWSNGMAALAALGVRPPDAEAVARMRLVDGRGRVLADLDLAKVAERHGQANVTVWRQHLLNELMARFEGGVAFGRQCVAVEHGPSSAAVGFSDGSRVEADLVIGADGVGSVVRRSLWGGRPHYSGTTVWEGRLRVDTGVSVPPHSVLAVADGATFSAAFGFADGPVHWFVDRHGGGQEPPTRDALMRICGAWPEPFPALAAATADEQLFETPIYLRVPPRRWSVGRVVLLGDAAHGMGPALGQGAGQAFADAVVLGASLREQVPLGIALARYQRRRQVSVWSLWIDSYLALRARRTGLVGRRPVPIPGFLAQAAFSRVCRPPRGVRAPAIGRARASKGSGRSTMPGS